MVIGALINNLALLLALGVLYSLIVRKFSGESIPGQILLGLLYGGMCFIVMLNPMQLRPGLIFDTRSVVLSLAGLFGGPLPAAIAVAIGGGLRLWLGGVGTLAGVAGVIWVGLAGCIYHRMLAGKTGGLSPFRIYAFGLVAELGQVASILLLPSEIVWPALQKMALPMMLVLPVGIATLGVLMSDVRSRLDAETQLKASERRLRDILDNSPARIYIKGADYRYQLANRSFLENYGLALSDVVGRTDYDIWGNDIADELRKNDVMAFADGQIIEAVETLFNKSGELRYSNTIKFPLRDENENIYALCGISTDITQRIQAEKEKRVLEASLARAQKMEAIGTLAGGIAHDFNNILSAIMGYTELAHDTAGRNLDNRDCLDSVMEAGTRARNLVRQILSFSREHEPERRAVNMAALLNETMGLVRASLFSTIEIKVDAPARPPMIYADPDQMHQVIMNLCTNAAHAMHQGGGTLGTMLEPVQVSEEQARRHPGLQPGGYIKLVVSDTGCGMPPEVAEKVFEPFFTTKEEGEGTGMGLSVVHGIVKKHGGHITLESEPGLGSTFTVLLPALEEGRAQPEAEVLQGPLPGGSERVLFVDDEEAIAALGKRMLGGLGYQVVALPSSQEALRMLEERPQQFDIVITDMTMPSVTGLELAQRAHQFAPGLPFIICSGRSMKIASEQLESAGIAKILDKPVGRHQLAFSLREVLDSRPS